MENARSPRQSRNPGERVPTVIETILQVIAEAIESAMAAARLNRDHAGGSRPAVLGDPRSASAEIEAKALRKLKHRRRNRKLRSSTDN